jgi:hypothetical protein
LCGCGSFNGPLMPSNSHIPIVYQNNILAYCRVKD